MDRKLYEMLVVFIVGFILVVGDYWAKSKSAGFVE